MLSNRLKFLSQSELDSFYALPQFNDTERVHFFSLNNNEVACLNNFTSLSAKLYFVLQLGYFKAKRQWFRFEFQQVHLDCEFVVAQHLSTKTTITTLPSKNTQTKIRLAIARLTESNCNKTDVEKKLLLTAMQTCRCSIKPKILFEEMLLSIEKNNFMIPAYTGLQDLIGKAISQEQLRLESLIAKLTPKYAVAELNQLLITQKNYYEITLVKKDQKNFTYTEVKKMIEHMTNYQRTFKFTRNLIPKLGIHSSMIDYYSSLINHYPVAQLHELPKHRSYLYLICYLYQRMQKISDNLVSSFIFYVNRYLKYAKQHGKDKVYESKLELNLEAREKVPEILALLIDNNIPDKDIRSRAFEIIPKDRFNQVINYLSGVKLDEEFFKWQHYDKAHNEVVKNLRPIFLSLDLNCSKTYHKLSKAVIFLKHNYTNHNSLTKMDVSAFPIEFIPTHVKQYIVITENTPTIKSINLARYEFCAYHQIYKGIKLNEVTLPASISHKSLDEDLVPYHKRKSIIKQLDHPLLSTPFKTTLFQCQQELDALYHSVNQRIESGANKSVKIEIQDKISRLSLLYNKKEDLTNHGFYTNLKQVDLVEVINYCQQHTGFLDCFTHLKPHHSKSAKDNLLITAVCIANGTHQGTIKMAASSDLNYQLLSKCEQNYIRLDTLKAANNRLSEAISKLPIFNEWMFQQNIIHSAVDGQKFQVRIDNLKAQHSAKYFPLKKGVSAYSLLANFIPLDVEIISPNLHESYFLFDILKNVTADLQVDFVAGDSHAVNPANYFITSYLPVTFEPHLIHINTKIKRLSSFQAPRQFKDMIIKPHHQIKEGLILEQENNINWITTSLLHGSTRQHVIVKKLSTLARHDKTCQAIAEFNRVYQSIYTLQYIDDPKKRKRVRGSLNRIEAYHQLRRAIAFANGGEFRGNSEIEIIIWNQSARLLANAIIYYNACLLTALYKKYEATGDIATLNIIKRISPIAWIHINLLGRFIFSTGSPTIDIEEIIKNVFI